MKCCVCGKEIESKPKIMNASIKKKPKTIAFHAECYMDFGYQWLNQNTDYMP